MKKLFFLSMLFVHLHAFAQISCNWAYIPAGTGTTVNTITHTIVDNKGDIIQCGKLLGVADMDPGSGPTDTSFSYPAYNYYLSKMDVTGKLIWIHYFNSSIPTAFFEFMGLKVNSKNEIIVGGNFYGVVDFDLSASGVDTLRSHQATYPDFFLAKYDEAGSLLWVFNIGEPIASGVKMQSLCVLPNDNIVVSANPTGLVDVDPGSAVNNTIPSFYNNHLICYDNTGNWVWNKKISVTYSYAIPGNTIASDANGNVYVLSVGYYEMTVTKFDMNGNYILYKTYGNFASGGRVAPTTIMIDQQTGEFYIAGTFGGTVQFDAWASSKLLSSSNANYQDGFIMKLNPGMYTSWVKQMPGQVAFGTACLDRDGGDIVAVGSISGTADLGSGFVLSTSQSLNPLYMKLDTAGITRAAYKLDGMGKYFTVNVLSPSSDFVTSGNVVGAINMSPSGNPVMLSIGSSNFFTAVYANTTTTGLPDPAGQLSLAVYPNPSVGSFTVDAGTGGTDIRIVNALGQTVYAAENMALPLMVQLNTKGVYLVQAIKGDQRTTQRIVVD